MKQCDAYQALERDYQLMRNVSLNDLFYENPNRGNEFIIDIPGLVYLDYSKNHIDNHIMHNLIQLAMQSNLAQNLEAMLHGDAVNFTEQRSALHIAMRSTNRLFEAQEMHDRLKQLSQAINNNMYFGCTNLPVTDIVNIGIGGSDLGVQLLSSSLYPYSQSHLRIHFVSSLSGCGVANLLKRLNPATTLFIVCSKTFTTQETILNATTIKNWLIASLPSISVPHIMKQHFIAVSANIQGASEFGVDASNIFSISDGIGGRYSIWSNMALAAVLYIGYDNFAQLISGANAMDQHFIYTAYNNNIPIVMALIEVWYVNFYQYHTHLISTYGDRLNDLTRYIQQLSMESNGKSTDINNNIVTYGTAPIVWGGNGNDAQHSYYQLLHQGTVVSPVDIILYASETFDNMGHHNILLVNALAQARALMLGRDVHDVHRCSRGDRPSNILLLPNLSPYTLGGLLALYEHKVYVESVIWGINPFDQMGVELGKIIARDVINAHGDFDSSTRRLMDKLQLVS